MPRPAKPPRLYLRDREGREALYVILDRGREVSTGFGPDGVRQAEAAFSRYLTEKHTPQWGDGDPALIPVPDVLTLYLTEHVPGIASPETVHYHMGPLLDYFGLMSCWDAPLACKA